MCPDIVPTMTKEVDRLLLDDVRVNRKRIVSHVTFLAG